MAPKRDRGKAGDFKTVRGMIELKAGDSLLVDYEAAITRIGKADAKRAFSRALNHEGRKAFTAIKRVLRKQTGLKAYDVNNAVKYGQATTNRLQSTIRATGRKEWLRKFGARQFKYGVRARPWNRSQRFNHAFIVKSLDGNVFINTRELNPRSGRKNAIRPLFGPSVPEEMLKDESLQTFMRSTDGLADRAAHEIRVILEGWARPGRRG
ncbi:hypothetical protein PE067_10585 [Paracoccus sp. DMF-8]|uniref:hypothetical protein n=1 Tax=Paracoccus sp. DMF-8 TaxID=3019445 RepID=UPI0023E8F55C|nr:hypothetical protein [Paracoccus sp. DMF-8]MDF3606547.1 hypothetical protein [Paracoccus sp. DMF-8]